MFVLLGVVVVSGLAGAVAAGVIRRWPQADPALSATRAIGEELGRRWKIRRFLRSRLDPSVAAGLSLSVALLTIVLGGAIIGVLAFMVRTNSGVVGVDQRVARWASTHVAGITTPGLEAITQLGSTPVIIGVALAGVAYGLWRRWGHAVVWFLLVVVGGQFVMLNLIKSAVDRARPAIHPFAILSSPSFPSGHATASAATYAALALVVARGRSTSTRAILAGIAVAIAVAVACSRMLLGVHWFSDVVAGLALGWAWFAVCAVAFGGRLLWFGAPAEAAAAGPPAERSPHVDMTARNEVAPTLDPRS